MDRIGLIIMIRFDLIRIDPDAPLSFNGIVPVTGMQLLIYGSGLQDRHHRNEYVIIVMNFSMMYHA